MYMSNSHAWPRYASKTMTKLCTPRTEMILRMYDLLPPTAVHDPDLSREDQFPVLYDL